MRSGVDKKTLDRLDRLIAEFRLHEGDPMQPVVLDELLEAYRFGYVELPWNVEAIAARWRVGTEEFATIAYNRELLKPEASARKRHAGAHEYGHIFCEHKGDLFIMWRATDGPDTFERLVSRGQERESDEVAAYLLVRQDALKMMHGQVPWYIGRNLDVTEGLIPIRWYIYQKFGR